LIVGGTAIWLIGDLGTSINHLANVSAEKRFLAAQTDGNESDMVAAERGILLHGFTKEPALVSQYNQQYADTSATMKNNCDTFRPLAESAEERNVVDAIETNRQAA